jgi:hypothetical protein
LIVKSADDNWLIHLMRHRAGHPQSLAAFKLLVRGTNFLVTLHIAASGWVRPVYPKLIGGRRLPLTHVSPVIR